MEAAVAINYVDEKLKKKRNTEKCWNVLNFNSNKSWTPTCCAPPLFLRRAFASFDPDDSSVWRKRAIKMI